MPRPIRYCTIAGCESRQVGRGWCRLHYGRWWEHGDPLFLTPRADPVRLSLCTIDGCHRVQKSLGWCQTHYRRFQRHGSPDVVLRVVHTGTPIQRFWSYVDRNGPLPERAPGLGSCWLWLGTGPSGQTGYGWFSPGGGRKEVAAHRWSYETFVGPIPEGLEIDHLCRVRACVRPDHLEPVTHAENIRRGDAPEAMRKALREAREARLRAV